ncbi:helix-turn-helix domain-containing protein [Pseudomonas nitroreducens]|uniref:helix-turn-helix domain-containing protein n=1 Tax=Pseudomonas nitroreducens TaxID=46680 RepID=UPI001480C6D9|nr:XRE family transcriptional regulator [Pseudomonas nitroreducens]NNN23391.1 ImmA/IrrE family metallo-endopeptidase [Pseudomonas nitroreducens]
MIGERLKRARAASGLSMLALGQQVGVSANMIKKYEHDESMPSSGVLIRLSKALSVRVEYFFRPVKVELQGVEYRKRSSTPQSLLKQIEADVLDQAERWQELANLWPEFPVDQFAVPAWLPDQIDNLEHVDEQADRLRAAWELGLNPIPDLIDVLESHGILVIITQVDVQAKFDGLQASVAGKPVIVISANWPGDRQRFTLAHELGHLLLHGRLAGHLDEEKACNRFASALLLPASAMRQQLGLKRHMLEMQELYLLKQEYGISMQGCLYRAADLEIIPPSTRERLFIVFGKQGWRKREPGNAYRQESTLLFQQLVYRALGEGIVGESKAAELLGVPVFQFHQARKLELLDAVAHQ